MSTSVLRPALFCSVVLMIILLAGACGTRDHSGAAQTPESTVPSGAVSGQDPFKTGSELFVQFGCSACHSTEGHRSVGPALNGIFGKEETLTTGATVVVDEAYLRESILDPDAKTVQGFSKGVMLGGISSRLDEIKQGNNVEALIEYIKSLN